MKKLMEGWRSFGKQVLNEQGDWYSEEHETLADKKFAERGADIGEWGHFATEDDPRGTSEPLTTDAPGMAPLEDIYHDSNFLKMIREDFLMGYLPPRQDEIISDLKGVISDYLTRLKGHEGDTQAIGE